MMKKGTVNGSILDMLEERGYNPIIKKLEYWRDYIGSTCRIFCMI